MKKTLNSFSRSDFSEFSFRLGLLEEPSVSHFLEFDHRPEFCVRLDLIACSFRRMKMQLKLHDLYKIVNLVVFGLCRLRRPKSESTCFV